MSLMSILEKPPSLLWRQFLFEIQYQSKQFFFLFLSILISFRAKLLDSPNPRVITGKIKNAANLSDLSCCSLDFPSC
jgi:hypothetical protein